MYATLAFAITLLGVFSVFEILKGNQKLSLLKYYILARLIIITAGRSQYVPIDDNNTKAGRLNNRRIRIVIMPTVTQVMNLNK